jgi:D-alanine-D-alanine ligase-like ATP-grasp enzyme
MISPEVISNAYIKSAIALKLPFYYDREWEGIEVHLAGKRYIFRGKTGTTPFNDGSTQDLTSNKFAVNYLLSRAGIPMPHMVAILESKHLVNDQWVLPDNLPAYPVVAKPALDHGCGKDVFCNIQDKDTLIEYLNLHKKKHTHFCIERFEPNLTSYRVVVFFNKVVAVTRRDPAAVTGDGLHTIQELMTLKNEQRKKNTTVPLGDLKVDKEYETKLKELNLTLDYIPKLNEVINLCYVCNSTRGGTMTALGRSICPENADLMIRAAKVLNLNLVGFDVLCEDILRPISTSRGFIIEANNNPDMTINEYALAGDNVPLSRLILKRLIRKHPIAYAWSRIKRMPTCSRLVLQYLSLFILLLIAVGLTHH